jgi:hypothetical protein
MGDIWPVFGLCVSTKVVIETSLHFGGCDIFIALRIYYTQRLSLGTPEEKAKEHSQQRLHLSSGDESSFLIESMCYGR